MGSVRLSEDLRHQIRNNAVRAFSAGNIAPIVPNEEQEALLTAIENSPIQKASRKLNEHMRAFGLVRVQRNKSALYSVEGRQRCNSQQAYNRNAIRIETPQLHTFSGSTIYFNWHESMIPDGWRSANESTPPDPSRDRELNFTQFELSNPYRKINFYSTQYDSFYDHITMDVADFAEEDLSPCLNMLLKNAKREFEYRQKASQFESQIRNLLNECNTLKQAIDAWPGVREFVPSDTLQKLYQKTTRVQKAKTVRDEIDFDSALADQVVLRSKLLGE